MNEQKEEPMYSSLFPKTFGENSFRSLRGEALSLLLLSGLFLIHASAKGGGCTDCLPAWDHTKEIVIDNNGNPSELHGHQINVDVNTQNMISSGELQADGADLRFMSADCELLCHTVDEGMNSSNTSIWVKVDTIQAASNDTIYMYYGNGGASDVADSSCVFDFYEGFEDGNTNNWTSNCVTNGGVCGTTTNTGGCGGDNCDPTNATTAEAHSGNNSAEMFAHASCFCSPYNGPINEFHRTVTVPNGDYVLEFEHKEIEEQHGYCSCTGCTASNINVCIDGTNEYNSPANCTFDNCNSCEDPWTQGSSSCFTVSGGSTDINFWEKVGDCKENTTWLDDIRLRKCPSPPASVGNTIEPMTMTVNSTDPTCNNNDGSITINVNGGTAPHQYSNDGGTSFQGSNDFNGLGPGSYQLVVEEAAGCSIDTNVTLTGDPVPSDLSFDVTDASCGSSDGEVEITGVTGGNTPYEYEFDGSGFSTTTVYPNLGPNTYTVTVRDDNGCTYTEDVTVSAPGGSPNIDTLIVEDDSCYASCVASIEMQVSGGTAPYQYSNDGGTSFQGGNLFDGLCAGSYQMLVEDDNGCVDSATVTVNEPPELQVSTPSDTTICVGGTATLSANASGGTPGYTYHWDNGLGSGQTHTVSPGSNTVYEVYAEDANGCTSAPSTIRVAYHPPLSLMSSDDDSICPGETTQLSATGSGGIGSGYSYDWSHGATGTPVTVGPGSSNDYIVTLEDGCESPAVEDTIHVEVNALPDVRIDGEDLSGCSPVNATLINDTDPAMVGGDIVWNFGDGAQEAGGDTVQHSYDTPGCYDVSLALRSPEGCVDSTSAANFVCVHPYPTADFDFEPRSTTVKDPEIDFTNLSTGASSYKWQFGGLDSSSATHPEHEFPNEGAANYQVCLDARNSYGCVDRTCKTIRIDGEFLLYVPNAFTPDGDGVNDRFGPVVQGADESDYRFMIYDRWGELIFETEDPQESWDGSVKGGSASPKSDVYVWKLITKNKYTGEGIERSGHVTIVR